MATAEPTEIPEEVAPPVVVVVVTRNPGPFLERALAALGAQDYPALSVLVVDAGSGEDPTARVGAALPGAFVRRVTGSPGFGGAANEALAAVQGATFFLVCHDDVVLDPTAVRVMVEEAYRSNAAIVGPKLVAVDNPEVILAVGCAIDRLGGTHTGIEPGEIDQEQHDAVRDVFYVSSAAMLVRADLFDELGGFDPDTFPGSEDLDLCWRARLAGARVMVAPDARARHGEAAGQRAAGDQPSRRELARRRVRVVLTCYSAATLLRVVPTAVVVAFVEAIAFALTSRRAGAFAELGAWVWNLLHFGRLRPARRRAQELRRVRDRDLYELQVGAGARAGAFLSQHHADVRMKSIGERGRDALDTFAEFMRHPAAIALIAFFVLLVVGSRDLFTDGVPQVGTMVRWPDVASLGGELTSAWRHTGLGSDVVAPPVLAMMAGLGTVFLGATGFAQTLVVVGAFAVGVLGAYRIGRAFDGGIGGAGIAALAYGVSAMPRNAVASGRLGPLVLFAFAPFIALLVLRAGRFPGVIGNARRPLLGLAIATAVLGAWYPPGALVGVVVAGAVLVAAIVVGDAAAALRSLGAALIGVIGAAVLLIPWTGTLLDSSDDPGALGLGFRPDLSISAVLRFESGPNGAGVASWGVLAAAVAGMLIANGPRLAWVTRAWMMAIAGYAVAVIPAAVAPDSPTVVPEAGLALAALGIAIAAGLGITALGERLKQSRVGPAQAGGVIGALGLVLASFGFLGDVVDGRWRAPDSWAPVLSFTGDALDEGEFRILWVGAAEALPLDPMEVDATLSWSMTRNGPGDARELLRAPETSADRVIERALRSVRAGQTSRFGRMLAPSGIRYVALARRNGLDGERGPEPPGVAGALGNQLDLARLGSEPGLVLYENLAWVPARAIVAADNSDPVPIGGVDPLRSAVRVDLARARPVRGGSVKPGTLLLAEAYDDGWSARVDDTDLPHGRAFGYTNAFTHEARGGVSFRHSGQSRRYGLLLFQAALWVVALTWWAWGRRKLAKVRVRPHREERRERRRIQEEIDFGDADFWEGQ
ncbi:MAG: glycosyltransferase [Acidimicrobiia bacterium]